MNEIGRTNNGDYIVEMTSQEYSTFAHLERSLSGEESHWHRSLDYRLQGSNLSRALLVIREWTEGLFLINSLQHYVTHLKDTYQSSKVEDASD